MGQIDVRERQLSASERKAATSNTTNVLLFVGLAVFVLGPLFACGGCGTYTSLTNERPLWGFLGITLAPLFVMLIVVAVAWVYIGRKRRAFQLACAAVPPAVTGGSAACHVCGADLATTTEAVVRCNYCSADNVVAPAVLDRAARQVVTVLDGFEHEVRRRSTSVKKAAQQASFATLGMGCITPVGVLAVFFLLEWALLSGYEMPFHPEYNYAEINTPHGSCVAKVQKSDVGDDWYLYYGNVNGLESEFRGSVSDLTLRKANYFTGKQVRLLDSKKSGSVVRVYGAWHGGVNEAVVKTTDGSEERVSVGGLCLGEGPAQ